MIETPAARTPRRFSAFHLVLIIPWVALVIDAFAPIRDNSFLWHITAGDLQIEAGTVLVADPFSFTVGGQEWLTQSWLAELFYSWGQTHWGLGFVPPMMLAMSTLTFVSVGVVAYRRSRSISGTALVLILSTALMISFLVPRPVIFSFALFALVIVAWDRPSVSWSVPLLFWVWAAVHGSFVIGLAYIGLSILAGKDWRRLSTAFVSAGATLLTAHGLGVLTILLDFSRSADSLGLLSEWKRPALVSWVFTPLLVGVVIIGFGRLRERIKLADAWLFVPFLVLAFSATRAIPPAWLALVPLVGTSLYSSRTANRSRFSPLMAGVFAAVVLILPFLMVSPVRLDEDRFPIAAAPLLENVPTFHDDRAGGYLIWDRGPEFQVYLDDRAELYGDRINEFVAVRDGSLDWKPVFARDGIQQVLLRADEPLVASLKASGWVGAYQDAGYVILTP